MVNSKCKFSAGARFLILIGDVVAWELTNGIDHIGIVTNMLSDSKDRYLIVHNIGAGTRIEDVLFAWTIKGHYRFF